MFRRSSCPLHGCMRHTIDFSFFFFSLLFFARFRSSLTGDPSLLESLNYKTGYIASSNFKNWCKSNPWVIWGMVCADMVALIMVRFVRVIMGFWPTVGPMCHLSLFFSLPFFSPFSPKSQPSWQASPSMSAHEGDAWLLAVAAWLWWRDFARVANSVVWKKRRQRMKASPTSRTHYHYYFLLLSRVSPNKRNAGQNHLKINL